MTNLCTLQDVATRPVFIGAPPTSVQLQKIPGFIEEASILVEGYLGHVYPAPPDDPTEVNPDPIPDAARIVTARCVARAVTAAPVDPNFDSYGSAMGGFTHTKHVAQDVLGGGVWLTHQDKMALDAITAPSRISNVSLYQPTSYPVGSVNGLLYPPAIAPIAPLPQEDW